MIQKSTTGFVFTLPLLIGVALFYLLPALACAILSLFQWSMTEPPMFAGVKNYITLLGIFGERSDPLFVQSLINTLVIALVVPFQVGGSLALALFLGRREGGYRILRLVVFLPTLVSPVAIYMMWRSVFFADIGLAAKLFSTIGWHSPLWLEDPLWSRPSLMLVILWESVGGFQMLFFLAGLRLIPNQMHDMAHLDGLGVWLRLRHVYWPWLRPLVLFNLSLGLIGAVQGGFEIAYMMTGGGPLRSTTTLSFFMFENAFQWQRTGYAAAIGVIIFLLMSPLLFLKFRKRNLA